MTFLRRHALIPTLLLSIAALGSYAVRGARVDWTFLFLPRNLALGLIPVALALAAVPVGRSRVHPATVAVLLGWLLFLPNSVYLVSDLIHLRERPGIPLVYDSAMCGLFAAAGVLAGVSSLSIVEDVLRPTLGRVSARVVLALAVLLNGLGVWMGRYQRWNSWDVATDPLTLVQAVWEPLVSPSAHLWGIALTYAAVLGVCWLAWLSVRHEPLGSDPLHHQ